MTSIPFEPESATTTNCRTCLCFCFQSINIMDYSLLVGVDRQKHELVFGIIDYLRQYTWDK